MNILVGGLVVHYKMSAIMVDRPKKILIEIVQKGLKCLIFIKVGDVNSQHKQKFIKGTLSVLRQIFSTKNPLKNDEKYSLFYLKSSLHFQDI